MGTLDPGALHSIRELPLYSEDLAPVALEHRTWNTWDLAAIWVGMAACIPTYILASYMLRDGLGAAEALGIILIANLIVTVPLALNGHAGVKYGLPFAVLGRACFGTLGVHIPAMVRALIACGWFGIQTWIGGLAIHAIACTLSGTAIEGGFTAGKFLSFAVSWSLTLLFVWRGTESIRRLERLAAPALLLVGLLLVAWGASQAGSFAEVLKQTEQLERPTAQLQRDGRLALSPLQDLKGNFKADSYRLAAHSLLSQAPWHPLPQAPVALNESDLGQVNDPILVQFRRGDTLSSPVSVAQSANEAPRFATWLFWLTAMVGFWATMSISIADITRFGRSQRAQVLGQSIGLPGTMLLYSFVSIFVTCAALIGFEDLLVAEDAPWDPVALLARFESPVVVVAAQLILFVATLTTNIAANVIAPANAFANLWPKKMSFRLGGLITGVIGVCIVPWLLFDRISDLLVFVSGLLGPVLGVMLADYYWIRRTRLSLRDLFDPQGCYAYWRGFNPASLAALSAGVLCALSGYFLDSLSWLYTASWFSGCLVSFTVYGFLMSATNKRPRHVAAHS